MGLSRNLNGPLSTAILGSINDVIFWGPTQPPEIKPQDSDIVHLVRIADRLDLIASQYLGDPQRSWIILLRNNLRLVPNDLVPGQQIFIPTIESLTERGIIPCQ